ncbi:hypothetical protein HK097_011477 [Rhizophlyctis rosea]|uniref:PH domain-containing protein n=1 Tax=Rhizophlyctis rosea TaxID=64517 RepID=A0AAD5X4S2_9FUNG|nr:hypothetical protein HK097_011477 [Rhizophlyctis rosea]
MDRQHLLPSRVQHGSNYGSRSASTHYSRSPSYNGVGSAPEKDSKERAKGGMVYTHADVDVDNTNGTKNIYPPVGGSYSYQHSQLLHDDSDEDQLEVTVSTPAIGTMQCDRRPSNTFTASSMFQNRSAPHHELEVDEDMCRPPASEIAREGYLWIQTSLHWKRYHTVATYDINGIGIIQLYIDEYDQTPNRILSLSPFKSVTPAPAAPTDAEVRTGRFEFHLTAHSSGTSTDGDICFAAENHIERNAWVMALKILCSGGKGGQEEEGGLVTTEMEAVDEISRKRMGDEVMEVPVVVLSTDETPDSVEGQTTPTSTIEALITELMDELKFRTSNLGKMVDRVLKGQANQFRPNSTSDSQLPTTIDSSVGEKLEEMHAILSKLGTRFEATTFSDLQDKMDDLQKNIMAWDERRQSIETELKETLSSLRNHDLLPILTSNHAELVSLLSQHQPTNTASHPPPSPETQTILQTLEPILLEIRARLTIALSRSPSPSHSHSQHTFDRPSSQMIVGMNDKLVRVTKLVEHVADSWEGKIREIQGRVGSHTETGGGDVSGVYARELASAVEDVEKRVKGVGKDVGEVDSKVGGMVKRFEEVRENVENVVDLLRGDDGSSVIEELKEFVGSLGEQVKDVRDRVMDSSVTSERLSALVSMMEVIQEGVSKLGGGAKSSTTTSSTAQEISRLTNMTESIHHSLVSYLPIDLDTKLNSIQHTLTTLSHSAPSHRITNASSSSSPWSSTHTPSPSSATLQKTPHPTPFEQEMTRHAITTSESLDSIQHTLARLVEWFDESGVLSSQPSSSSPPKKTAAARVVDVTETDEIKDTVLEIRDMLLQDRRGAGGGGGGGTGCECGQVSARELFKMREERDSLKREIEELRGERDRLSGEGGGRGRRYM